MSFEIKLLPLDGNNHSENYHDWLNNPKVNMYLEARHYKHTPRTCIEFIDFCNSSDNSVLLGIFIDGVKHIGTIKAEIDVTHKVATIGFFIGDDSFWGKGVGGQALNLFCELLFSKYNVEKIEAGCYSENSASVKTLIKSGFQQEGIRRNSLIHSGKRQDLILFGKSL